MTQPDIEYDSTRDFVTLEAWKKASALKLFCYKEIIPILPSEERFNLGEQVRRAGISVTANISEGYGRYYRGDGIHFYRIARGSIYELKDHITTCLDLNFIDKDLYDRGIILIEDAKKTLNGYIKFLKNNKASVTAELFLIPRFILRFPYPYPLSLFPLPPNNAAHE